MRAFTYVIATDAGSAPNYDEPCTTLAICKPKIRLGASVGDLVMAFSGQNVHPEPHSVCWAGVVKEKLTFDQYWRDPKFGGKKPKGSPAHSDNIYKPDARGLAQVANNVHDEGNVLTDLSGKYVLCFEPAWTFRAAAPVLPEQFGLRMTGSRRGHRVHEIDQRQWSQLERWLDESAPKRIAAATTPAAKCTKSVAKSPGAARVSRPPRKC